MVHCCQKHWHLGGVKWGREGVRGGGHQYLMFNKKPTGAFSFLKNIFKIKFK